MEAAAAALSLTFKYPEPSISQGPKNEDCWWLMTSSPWQLPVFIFLLFIHLITIPIIVLKLFMSSSPVKTGFLSTFHLLLHLLLRKWDHLCQFPYSSSFFNIVHLIIPCVSPLFCFLRDYIIRFAICKYIFCILPILPKMGSNRYLKLEYLDENL